MAFFIPLALCLAASYLVGTTIYNLYFHPLAKTPGPFLARISTIPSFIHACRGDRHIWVWQNFQIYGDRFRAAPNLVVFNTPRAYTDIYGLRSNCSRSGFYRAWKRNQFDVNTITAIDPALHAHKRKLLNLVFTEHSLKSASPLLIKHIGRWVELLSSPEGDGVNGLAEKSADGWSQPRNMATWVDHLVFDVLGDLCFGASFDTKEPGENKLKNLPHLIMKTVALGYKVSKSPIFDAILWLQPRGLNNVLEKIRNKELKDYNTFVEEMVDKRIAAHKTSTADPTREDMFHFLLNAIDPDTNLPAYANRHHLVAELRLLVLAGTDTTAMTLCGLFFYLSHNPRVLAKLTAEVRSTFNSAEEIMLGTTLSRCKYLRACIDETLRMAHPAPAEMPREVLPGGAIIDGNAYPAGTVVGCAGWSMGRDESVYGDVNTYRPERWIPSPDKEPFNSEADVLRIKKAFHPFSIGAMNCAGQNLATLELLLVAAKTVWATDFRLAPGLTAGEGRPELGWGQRSRNQYMVKDAYLCLKDGPALQFRPRAT